MIARRYVKLINLVLVLLILATGAYLFWAFYFNPPETEKVEWTGAMAETPPPPTPPERDHYDIIVSRDLWKEKFAAPKEGPPPTPVPPPCPSPSREREQKRVIFLRGIRLPYLFVKVQKRRAEKSVFSIPAADRRHRGTPGAGHLHGK